MRPATSCACKGRRQPGCRSSVVVKHTCRARRAALAVSLVLLCIQFLRVMVSMNRSLLFSAIGLLLGTSTAMAADPFVVSDIRVEGLQRISAGAVFAA